MASLFDDVYLLRIGRINVKQSLLILRNVKEIHGKWIIDQNWVINEYV